MLAAALVISLSVLQLSALPLGASPRALFLAEFPRTSVHSLANSHKKKACGTASMPFSASNPSPPPSAHDQGPPTPLADSPTLRGPSFLNPVAADYAILMGKALSLDKAWLFPPPPSPVADQGAGSTSKALPPRLAHVVIKRSLPDVDNDRERTFLHHFDLLLPPLHSSDHQHGRQASCPASSGPSPPPSPQWLPPAGSPQEVTGASVLSYSPSGRFLVIFKEEKEGAEEAYAEVWGRTGVLRRIRLGGVHGKVVGGGVLGGTAWSQDEEVLAYVARVRVQGPGRATSAFEAAGAGRGKEGEGPAGGVVGFGVP
ncbi:hypothetical protein Naga_100586g4, partial [Nannochloropsis gaditana]